MMEDNYWHIMKSNCYHLPRGFVSANFVPTNAKFQRFLKTKMIIIIVSVIKKCPCF